MSKPKTKILLLSFLALLLSNFTFISANNSNILKENVEVLMKKYNIKSSSIAYKDDSNPKLFLSEFENKNINENSIFEAGSNGKVVASYITLCLIEETKLNLDDKIIDYLDKAFITDDKRLSDITVKQLLSHSSGFSPSFEFGLDKNIYFNPGEKFSVILVLDYIYLQNIIENITNKSFEEVSKEYVFNPLGMKNSTFESAKTVTPYINSSMLVIYLLVVFVICFIILSIISFLIFRKKSTSKNKIFIICFFLSGIINIIFLMLLMSKLVLPFLFFILISFILFFLFRKNFKLLCISFLCYLIIIFASGIILNKPIPVSNDIIKKSANPAYSFKTTSLDMSLFLDELLDKYNKKQGPFYDIYKEEIKIDENNSWGLGIAIENTDNNFTFWHSGINPGFQSLFVLYPEKNSYITIFTNSDNGLDFSKEVARTTLNINADWDIKRTDLKQ